MRPPALTAPLNGRFGLAPKVCFEEDWAEVMKGTARTNAARAVRRIRRSQKSVSFYAVFRIVAGGLQMFAFPVAYSAYDHVGVSCRDIEAEGRSLKSVA